MQAPPQKRQAAMIFILITLFIDILGIGIIIPILPELVKEFVGGDTARAGLYVGAISSVYALTLFFCAPILGALSDQFGRRKVILVSLFGLGIDYLIQGFAPTIGWLFVGRMIAGGMGSSFTTVNAYIADVSTAKTRAQNFGLVGVAFGMGFIFGPVLGGVLGGISLRLPFFFSAGLALVNWLYGYFVLPESLSLENRDRFSLRKSNPFSSIRNLRAYPLVAGLAVAFAFISLAQRGLENSWVLHAGFRYGWSEMQNGLTLGLVGIMAAFVNGFLIRLVIPRLGERKTVLCGLAIATLSFFGYGIAEQGWMALIVIVLGSVGGVAGPALQGLIAGSVSPSDQGKVQGALTSLMSLTSIFAPLIFTTGLFSYFISDRAPIRLPGAPFFLSSVLTLISLILMVRLFRRIPQPEPTTDPVAAEQVG